MAAPTTITTNANLLEGVGEFPPQAQIEVEHLLPAEFRELGIDGDALLGWHTTVWTRLQRDLELKGIDPTNYSDWDSSIQNRMKAAVCHMIMSLLHEANKTGGDTKFAQSEHTVKSAYHATQYERILSALAISMPSGRTARLGATTEIFRG